MSTLTLPNRLGVPGSTFVPARKTPRTNDELGFFREARRWHTSDYFFAAQIQVDPHDRCFNRGDMVIFSCSATPTDGQIVCAVCETKDKPDSLWQRSLSLAFYSSRRLERLIERFSLLKQQPTTRSFLLRRYREDGESYLLETLDGSGLAVRDSSTTETTVLGVATPFIAETITPTLVLF